MKQRTKQLHHIHEILEQIQVSQKWNEKYVIHQLRTNWSNLIEEKFASHTEKIEFRHSTLYIFFDNPSAKDEFSYQVSEFKETLREFFGEDIVKDVKLK